MHEDGAPRAVHVLVSQTSYVYPLYNAAYRSVEPARNGDGVWGACQHRFHAARPGSTPLPANWNIDASGILRAIGPLAINATESPTDGTRLGDVANAFPDLEMTRTQDGTCTAYSANAAASFTGLAGQGGSWPDRRRCTEQLVNGVISTGALTPTLGPQPGAPAAGLSVFSGPALSEHGADRIPLNADSTKPHWTTVAQVRNDVVVGYLAERTSDSTDSS